MGLDEQNDALSNMHAVMLGIGDGVGQVVRDKQAQASSLIEPGDQRHIPHPLDNFEAGIYDIWHALATPADMNINHSAHPVDSLIKAHNGLVSTAADHLSEKGLAQGLREFSAFATVAIIENVDPFRKIATFEHIADIAENAGDAKRALQTGATVTFVPIDWNTYEHLLGQGSQLPKLKPLRDFSDLMVYEKPVRYGFSSRIVYQPQNSNKIVIDLYHHSGNLFHPGSGETFMRFLVRAEGNCELHGTGPEMFHSAMKLLDRQGVRVDKIIGNWESSGNLSANYDVFANAFERGVSVIEAVRLTPTGRWTADAGYTEVGGYSLNRLIGRPGLPDTLNPEFTRPMQVR